MKTKLLESIRDRSELFGASRSLQGRPSLLDVRHRHLAAMRVRRSHFLRATGVPTAAGSLIIAGTLSNVALALVTQPDPSASHSAPLPPRHRHSRAHVQPHFQARRLARYTDLRINSSPHTRPISSLSTTARPSDVRYRFTATSASQRAKFHRRSRSTAL